MYIRRREFLKLCGKVGLAIGLGGGLSGCLEMGEERAFHDITQPHGTLHPVRGTYITGQSAGDAETLNWALAADNASLGYVELTMDGLITYDNDLNMQLRWLERPIRVVRGRTDLYPGVKG